MAAYVKKNRAKHRHAAKLKTYGLVQEQLTALLEHQEHQCPICLKFLAYPVTPSIDHSHQTGVVRGVLCRKCNAAIGLLEENTDNLERAIEYLSIHRRREINSVLSGAISTTNSKPSSESSLLPA
ncbi:endonuclease VII domain-containing protein [Gellertiella hungarica]